MRKLVLRDLIRIDIKVSGDDHRCAVWTQAEPGVTDII